MPSNPENSIEMSDGESTVRMKVPKRVLHFSDGIIEEFSESEDEVPTEHDSSVTENPEGWGPWLLYKLRETGETTLAACDYVGEALASFLGITSPKYQYELEEYKRIAAERKEEEEKAKGWEVKEDDDVKMEQPVTCSTRGPTAV